VGQLGRFIPWSLTSILKVNSVGEHCECSGFEDEFVSSFLNVLRPAEGAFFKPLGNDPIAGAIEVEDFDEGATCDVCW